MSKESQAEEQNQQLEKELEAQKEATEEQQEKAEELESENQEAQKEIEEAEAAREQEEINNKVNKTRIGGTWVALILGIVALAALLVFILQNQDEVMVQLFAWELNVPLGVGFLFAALFGALIMACVGAARMFQLRRQIRKRS